jgi:hypothetical protein
MKLKSLLFGTAAVIAAGTGAQAADLPTVEPVEYVRICDVFGSGFFYIPGTETCLKVGGYVRAESHYVTGDIDDPDNPSFNNWTSRVRGQINLDARTQTNIGLVRAYVALEATIGPSSTSGPLGPSNYNTVSPGLAAAYVTITNDWGTYTAGRRGSMFDFWGSDGWGTRVNIDDPTTDVNLFAWTFAGGNGFSATFAAEDPSSNGRRFAGSDAVLQAQINGILGAFPLTLVNLPDNYGGQEMPDLVGNIRIDQGWGSAQVMGVVRRLRGRDVTLSLLPNIAAPDLVFTGADDKDWGWAVGAGLSLGIPGGWSLNAQGGYTEGALGYITTDPLGVGDFSSRWGAISGGTAGIDPNTAWTVRAGISGPVGATLSAWLDGSYTHVEDSGDFAILAAAPFISRVGWDYDYWGVKGGFAWNPAAGLTMGPEVA